MPNFNLPDFLRELALMSLDGTVAELIRLYETDELSPYRALKHKTRVEYERYLKVLRNGCSARRLDSVKAADIWRWYRATLSPSNCAGSHPVASRGGRVIPGHCAGSNPVSARSCCHLHILQEFGAADRVLPVSVTLVRTTPG